MATIYLGIGSNVGNSREHIKEAIALLGGSIRSIVQAPIYTSKAVGYTDQPDFFNTVVKGDTTLKPIDLLRFVKDIERSVGRIERFRWGPREIDIDIIFYDDVVMAKEILTIPHPRFRERDFVLRPLGDISPALIDPISKRTITELLGQLPEDNVAILKKLSD